MKKINDLEKRVAELERQLQSDHEKLRELFDVSVKAVVKFSDDFCLDIPEIEKLRDYIKDKPRKEATS